jgi:2-polyprenyl-3-methyl-5-hydroxy-6-metoxy-1,4-benzoquinol methylase
LIFVDRAALPALAEERAIYELHRNHPDDPGYRRFLERLAAPLAERLGPARLEGLDFGCGPGPTLSRMMEERGYSMSVYDPLFAADRSTLGRTYDFITCSETFEHFHAPAREWSLLLALLRPGGWLGVMTQLARDVQAFAGWRYKNDVTHVSFFSRETFEWLARRDRLVLEFVGADVILLRSLAT